METCFFDLDGPILDVSEKYYRVYADLVSERGGRPLPQPEYWEHKRRRTPDAILLEKAGLDDFSDFQDLRRERIETPAYLRLDRVWPAVPELLHLMSASRPLTLVTLRHSADSLLWELDELGLRGFFRRILAGDAQAGRGERFEVKVRLVQQAFGPAVAPGWWIGDTETDIRAGQALGLKTVAVSFGIRTAELLSLCAPTVLLQTPSALVQWVRRQFLE